MKRIANEVRSLLYDIPFDVLIDEMDKELDPLGQLTNEILDAINSLRDVDEKPSSDNLKVIEKVIADIMSKHENSKIVFKKITNKDNNLSKPRSMIFEKKRRMATLYLAMQEINLELIWSHYVISQLELMNRDIKTNEERTRLMTSIKRYQTEIKNKIEQLGRISQKKSNFSGGSDAEFAQVTAISNKAKEFAMHAKYHAIYLFESKINKLQLKIIAAKDKSSLAVQHMVDALKALHNEMLERISALVDEKSISEDMKRKLRVVKMTVGNHVQHVDDIVNFATQKIASFPSSSSSVSKGQRLNKQQKSFVKKSFEKYFSSEDKTHSERVGFLKQLLQEMKSRTGRQQFEHLKLNEESLFQFIIDNKEPFVDMLENESINEKDILITRLAEIVLQHHEIILPEVSERASPPKPSVVETLNSEIPASTSKITAPTTSAPKQVIRFINTKTPGKLTDIFNAVNQILNQISSNLLMHDDLYMNSAGSVDAQIMQHAYVNLLYRIKKSTRSCKS